MSDLAGKRILVTRPIEQAAGLVNALRAAGAEAVLFPCIAIHHLPINEATLAGPYDWIVLTSQNAVEALADRLELTDDVQIAVVGPETARSFLATFGRSPNIVGAGTGQDLIAVLPDLSGRRVFLPQSEIAADRVEQGLRGRGAIVTLVNAYAPLPVTEPLENSTALESIDAITFASGSAVRGFAGRVGNSISRFLSVPAICMGSSTAAVARDSGFTHVRFPDFPRTDGLIAELAAFFSTSSIAQESAR